MATIKFDLILQEFSRRIGDRLASAFTPGGGAFPAGVILDAADAISYVNRALNEYFERNWMAVEGDRVAFGRLFPELIKDPGIGSSFTTGIYTVASPLLDFWTLYDAYISASVPCRIENPEMLIILKTGKYPRHQPTATKPIMVSTSDKIYVFPASITTGYLIYIRQPINPSTGAFLIQNGSEDSPFAYSRNSSIAAVAEELYWNEKKPKG